MTDAERLAAVRAADDTYAAVEAALGEIIGYKLFTLMVIDRATGEAARVYSSDPEAYPVKGRKPLGELTYWGQTVLEKGQPFIGYDAEDIRKAFFDYETIYALGCESVLNLPVISDGVVIGTINMLHEAGWYTPEHAARGAPFAECLVQPYLDWAARGEG